MARVSEQPDAGQGLYSGFEGYRNPSEQDLLHVLRNGIVALDANVLLDLYRYGETARDEFFALLDEVQQCLWVPHQVLKEFWRNRASVLAEVSASALVPDLRKARDAALTALARWRIRTRAEAEAEACAVLLHDAFDAVAEKLTPVPGLDADAIALDTNVDAVLARLQSLIEGRAGRPPNEDRVAELIKLGVERFARLQPPGYMDAQKHGQTELGTGDFLLWSELLERARAKKADVLFVSRDEKEDWWHLDSRRRLIGPRVELVDEMLKESGGKFYLLRPEQFLGLAGGLGVRVAAETIEDASRISRAAEPAPVASDIWTYESVQELLDRLRALGAHVQASVIEEAASAGGWVARERVFEIGGYDESRQLKGFTRPIRGVVDALVEEGLLAETVGMPLWPTYPGPGKADGFAVPDDAVESLSSSRATKQPTWLDSAKAVMRGSDHLWSVDQLVEAIRAANLRDLTWAKTPQATLRRDLRHRGQEDFEEVEGRFRLRSQRRNDEGTTEEP